MERNPGIDVENGDDRIVIAERESAAAQVEKGLSQGSYRSGRKPELSNLTAEGFAFFSQEEAEAAVRERKKIDYLEKRIDYSNPENVRLIYEKAIEDKVFRTPVGMVYLYKLREYLLKSRFFAPETVTPIPLYSGYEENVKAERAERAREKRSAKRQESSRRAALTVSVMLNLLLTAAVIAMFIITLYAEQPNILNYERALTNRYAGWEQELTAREQAIRARERELFEGQE